MALAAIPFSPKINIITCCKLSIVWLFVFVAAVSYSHAVTSVHFRLHHHHHCPNIILPVERPQHETSPSLPVSLAIRETSTRLACKNGKSLKGKLAEQFCRTIHSHPASFNVIPIYICASGRCVGVCRAITLIGNAWRATSVGKIGPVETGLITGPAATALYYDKKSFFKQQNCPIHSHPMYLLIQ